MGIGSAVRGFRYDDNGQLLNASFADYHIPTAHEVPKVRIGHGKRRLLTRSTASRSGEGGRMGAPSAVVRAVEDA
jgi:CO/xanthine dehydrogenase Mo-binding subunit